MSSSMAAGFRLDAAPIEPWPEGSLRQLMYAGPLRRDGLRLVVEALAKALTSRQDGDPARLRPARPPTLPAARRAARATLLRKRSPTGHPIAQPTGGRSA